MADIDSWWQEYAQTALPPDATDREQRHAKATFYAGVSAAYSAQASALLDAAQQAAHEALTLSSERNTEAH